MPGAGCTEYFLIRHLQYPTHDFVSTNVMTLPTEIVSSENDPHRRISIYNCTKNRELIIHQSLDMDNVVSALKDLVSSLDKSTSKDILLETLNAKHTHASSVNCNAKLNGISQKYFYGWSPRTHYPVLVLRTNSVVSQQTESEYEIYQGAKTEVDYLEIADSLWVKKNTIASAIMAANTTLRVHTVHYEK